MQVKVLKMFNDVEVPQYATTNSAGMDVRAYLHYINNIDDKCVKPSEHIAPKQTKLIPTGLKFKIPDGYAMFVLPRSGLSLKTDLRIANAPGLIDPDYLGEVKIICTNTGTEDIIIYHNDRIAQLVIQKVEQAEFVVVAELEKTDRNEGGFGSTGVK